MKASHFLEDLLWDPTENHVLSKLGYKIATLYNDKAGITDDVDFSIPLEFKEYHKYINLEISNKNNRRIKGFSHIAILRNRSVKLVDMRDLIPENEYLMPALRPHSVPVPISAPPPTAPTQPDSFPDDMFGQRNWTAEPGIATSSVMIGSLNATINRSPVDTLIDEIRSSCQARRALSNYISDAYNYTVPASDFDNNGQ
jgi:hypothetical protein